MPQDQSPQYPTADLPSPDKAVRPGMAVPKSLIVWIALLLLSFIVPTFIPAKQNKSAPARKDQTLSATEFSDLTDAETKVRYAFGTKAFQRGLRSAGGIKRTSASRKPEPTELDKAAKTYRDLLKTQSTPGVLRRIFIIDHARQVPLDETLLEKDLPRALKEAGVQPDKITTEQRLWRGIYGKPTSVAAADLPRFTDLIKATNLRFLKTKALADLYAAAGETKQASAYENVFTASATRSVAKQGALNISLLLVFLTGLFLLILFLVAAKTGNWGLINRQATLPRVLGWGDLLDTFVFYLALMKFTPLIASFVVSRLSLEPTPATLLTFYASLQAGIGLTALLYLWRTARKRGVTLADIGLRAPRGLLAEIGYGIGGFCAVLPITLLLGVVSRLIFQHDQTRTPNPIMPLMAAEQDPVRRLIIFLMVSVGAPLFEELFFRGTLFSGLRTRYGWVLSGVISGAVFALAHPPQDWLPIFGLGFAFATMREMRQSLVPTMTAHFLQNSLAFISISLLFGS